MHAKMSYAEMSLALEPVYDLLATNTTDEPWKWPVCALWSTLALPLAHTALQSDTIEHIVRVPTKVNKQKYGIPFTFHHMLADLGDEDPLIIDGTYLQFEGKNRLPDAPHVLVAPASRTPGLLAEANLEPDHHNQWRVDLYEADVFERNGRYPLPNISKEPL